MSIFKGMSDDYRRQLDNRKEIREKYKLPEKGSQRFSFGSLDSENSSSTGPRAYKDRTLREFLRDYEARDLLGETAEQIERRYINKLKQQRYSEEEAVKLLRKALSESGVS